MRDEKREETKTASARLRQWINGCVDYAVAALNGIAGDYIKEQDSHLAIPMRFFQNRRPLSLTSEALLEAHPNATSRICIFVHGLCFTEKGWEFPNDPTKNYGSLLQRDLGYTPFFVRYNSGLHVSQSGKDLSNLIAELLEIYPRRVKEIMLIGHSQGGLVIRSACHYGRDDSSNWTDRVSRVFFLGTPQLGAPLEKFVNVLTAAFKAVRTPSLRSVADFLNFRSAAIKDLRFGYTLDEEWMGSDPDALLQNERHHAPLLPGTTHYAIAATLTREPGHPISRCLGDGMVRLPSAEWKSRRNEGSGSPIEHRAVISGISHFRLPRHPAVYRQIKSWCREMPKQLTA